MLMARDYMNFRLGNRFVSPAACTIEQFDGNRHERVHVEPRVMQLLLALHNHPDEVVTRAELAREVWGEQPINDDALNRCVSELRHALGDDARQPQFIKTEPRQGYRLMVHPADPQDSLPEPSDIDRAAENNAQSGAPEKSKAAGLIVELRRRKVFRIAMTYTIVAWGIVQTMDVMWPHLPLPNWPLTMLILLALLGFPIAVVLAWVFEITPEGLVLDMPTRESHIASAELSRRSIDFVIIGALLIVVATQAYLLLRDKQVATPRLTNQSAGQSLQGANAASVAVLPFSVSAAEPQDAALGDGFANELLTLLNEIKGLEVVPKASSFAFRGVQLPIRDIGLQLGVATVLAGSVSTQNGIVNVNAQLIDTESQLSLWSRNFVRPLPEIHVIQSTIATAVMQTLDQRAGIVRQPEVAGFRRAPIGNLDAYSLFLQASALLPRRDRKLVLKSIQLFSEAIRLEEQFGRAHAGLAAAKLLAGIYGWLPAELAYSEAAASARVALSLNPNMAEPFAVLAELQRQAGNFHAAEQMFRMALLKDNESVLAYHWFAAFLLEHGRFSEALNYAQKAHQLNPASPAVNGTLAMSHWFLGDLAKANHFWARAEDFGLQTNNYLLGVELALRSQQAELALERWKAYLAARGRTEQDLLTRLVDLLKTDRVGAYRVDSTLLSKLDESSLLLVLVLADEIGTAITVLGSFTNQNGAALATIWGPIYSGLRGHPEFEAWLRANRYVDYWRDSALPDLCQFVNETLICR